MFRGGDGDDDAHAPDEDGFAAARERLVDRLQGQRNLSAATTDALQTVPRHEFVPEERREDAYVDRPMPIGQGQTISAPHMVAEMVDLLDLSPGDRVLEIGTGCGYHAAVTAEVVGEEHVYSVEYHDALADSARDRLADMGYEGINVRQGDGHEGWPEHAPYDAAYLTCAAPEFPDAVVEQVRTGGRILGPLGNRPQRLVLATKRDDGSLAREHRGRVRFVPMQG